MSKAILTLVLLIISNTFMTFAWYGNLKLQEMKVISQNTSIVVIVLISWCVALLEYSFLIPANRIGSEINSFRFHFDITIPENKPEPFRKRVR